MIHTKKEFQTATGGIDPKDRARWDALLAEVSFDKAHKKCRRKLKPQNELEEAVLLETLKMIWVRDGFKLTFGAQNLEPDQFKEYLEIIASADAGIEQGVETWSGLKASRRPKRQRPAIIGVSKAPAGP